MQVVGMLPRFVGQTETGADGNKKHDYGKVSQSFHSISFRYVCRKSELLTQTQWTNRAEPHAPMEINPACALLMRAVNKL
jgi:hypothetical protein